MNKLRLWNQHACWEEANTEWEKGAKEAAEKSPIKTLKKLPSMPGIAEENLKWKSLKWMLLKDRERKIIAEFFRHPFKYAWSFLRIPWKKIV